ncbi:hypothetical protein QR680_010412 [Steinernema hermaphroditum]|uniref:Uncharacterized protein n=1 Tax=Steinernema hermaphroditum TaxID=289476 RepID=A0AA39MBN3_9BILA|nr:hypothetical protein QR680_010412 [Steinernema hermaphroditum]
MDTIPYDFCHDVWSQINFGCRHDLARAGEFLQEPWRSATMNYIEKCRNISVRISKDDAGWFCTIVPQKAEKGPNSVEELLATDRRYLICHGVTIGGDLSCLHKKLPCSKEVIARKLIPLLNRHTRSWTSLHFHESLPTETAVECLKMFRNASEISFDRNSLLWGRKRSVPS